jgi:hypothetical protein
MKLKGLLILSTVLLIGSGDALAMRLAGRSHRTPQARIGTTRTLKNSGMRGTRPDAAPRNGPVNAYSSRGHKIKPYRNKKSIRGGGRGTIKILR